MLVNQWAARAFAPYPHLFAKRQPDLKRGDDVLRYPVLKLEHVVEVALETVRPDVAPVQAVDQLCRQSHALAGVANGRFQHIARAKDSSDVADVPRLSLEHKTRITLYHQQLWYFRQRSQHVFHNTVREIH